VAVRRRAWQTAALAGATTMAILLIATLATPSWDLSESRANSFSIAEEAALRRITGPVRIEAHLAPADPRRFDLDRRVLKKLRRVLPDLEVRYVSATTIGLFEQTNPHYGEVWYELGGRRVMSRATTPEGVLETLFDLSGVSPGAEPAGAEFRGHPLAVPPRGAAWVFYVVWPAVTIGLGLLAHRRRT
jgi:hypothetical protein